MTIVILVLYLYHCNSSNSTRELFLTFMLIVQSIYRLCNIQRSVDSRTPTSKDTHTILLAVHKWLNLILVTLNLFFLHSQFSNDLSYWLLSIHLSSLSLSLSFSLLLSYYLSCFFSRLLAVCTLSVCVWYLFSIISSQTKMVAGLLPLNFRRQLIVVTTFKLPIVYLLP